VIALVAAPVVPLEKNVWPFVEVGNPPPPVPFAAAVMEPSAATVMLELV
jgi:hypothetical protein